MNHPIFLAILNLNFGLDSPLHSEVRNRAAVHVLALDLPHVSSAHGAGQQLGTQPSLGSRTCPQYLRIPSARQSTSPGHPGVVVRALSMYSHTPGVWYILDGHGDE